MKSSIALAAILAALTQAAEENHFENEQAIIDGLESISKDHGKFYAYTVKLGEPAMHPELEDGK